jgi:hypothetical protein
LDTFGAGRSVSGWKVVFCTNRIGDKSGLVVVWDSETGKASSFRSFGAKSKSVSSIACHPKDSELVILGFVDSLSVV